MCRAFNQSSYLTEHQRIHTGGKSYNVKSVVKPLMHNQALFDTMEFVVDRNPTNVQNMSKVLFEHNTLFNTSKFILVRGLKNVQTVA